jgi:hypothetical protein
MAQLKDLIVSGVTRCLGTLYAANIVGNLQGTATNATADNLDQNISSTYIKGLEAAQDSGLNGQTITLTFGDGNTDTITVTGTTYSLATDTQEGVVKLYSSTGNNTDGPMDQAATTSAINAVYVSPTFTGTPLAPTVADSSDNSTKIATTSFVQAAIRRSVEELFDQGLFIASAATADQEQLGTASRDLLAFTVVAPTAPSNE